MTAYTQRVWKLRIGMALVGLILVSVFFTPTAFWLHTGYAATDAAAASQPTVPPQPSAIVVADPARSEQSWWQATLAPVFSVLGTLIAAFLVAGLRKLTRLIENKWKVDVPDKVERMMYEKARWAVAFVEEKAEKRLLHGDGKKTPGAEKIGEVVDLLQKFADGIGYGHEWQKDKVEALAEGVLHVERDKSIGSAGDRAKKLEAKKNENA